MVGMVHIVSCVVCIYCWIAPPRCTLQGGTARFLAKTFGCHITCFNLGENQNKYNLQKAHEEGISHLVTVVKVQYSSAVTILAQRLCAHPGTPASIVFWPRWEEGIMVYLLLPSNDCRDHSMNSCQRAGQASLTSSGVRRPCVMPRTAPCCLVRLRGS